MKFDELLQQSPRGEDDASPAVPGTDTRARDLKTILTIVNKVNTSLVLSEVLALVLDGAIHICRADRGFLMLANPGRQLEFAVGRTAQGMSIPPDSFQVSSSVLQDVFSTGESLCIENALDDERFERRKSVVSLELQTILCSPLKTVDDIIGVIYVDSKNIQPVDSAEVLSMFEILAGQAATAIKNARMHEDLKRSYNALSEANEQIVRFERMAMKGEISAEVSHELKNMMGVVILQLELLKRRFNKMTPEGIQSIIEQTLKSAQRVGSFSANLMSRAHATTNLRVVDPKAILMAFVDFIKVLPKFRQSPITISHGADVPHVSMDTDQINQVLLNLVNNAVESDPEAAILISSRVDPASGFVSIQVRDNGPGIEEKIRTRLFKERVTTKPDGHGYGLPICRQIIEQHGGTIRVDSDIDVGSTFTISLPPSLEQEFARQITD
jgi:signal transduction histidine kinase